MRKTRWLQGAFALALALMAPLAFGADHADHISGMMPPAEADITDIYAWNEGSKLLLVMNVLPFATQDAKFSDAVQYAFHVESSAGYGMAGDSKDIICTFDAAQTIQCWVGTDDYVTGDASKPAGISSDSGQVKVFAGLRADPFYFNLSGFNDTVDTVKGAAGGLTFDGAGCPQLDAATSTALIGMLQGSNMGMGPAMNDFATLNVLSIVLEVDKGLVTSGGATVAVWGSTHQAGG